MKTTLCLSAIMAAAYALPSPSPAKCGADSNCELVNINSTMSYRFKSGFEPGSANHQKQFHPLPARQDNDIELRVIMGKTMMQWGCDVDVGSAITGTIDDKCQPNAGCDPTQALEFDVKKWEGESEEPSDAKLKITADGKYYDQDIRDFLKSVLQMTVTDDSVQVDEQEWVYTPPASGQHWGLPGDHGDCAIKEFPTYVAVVRFEDENMKDYMEIRAELVEPKENCLAASILGGIAGAINPLAGKFFSVAKVVCEAAMAF
ncbi:hypothetical protein F5B22DRAFT_612888 [Xylaria bambusicola]|uniref:uncharacterized protein n=1 Tax=Xylaria bambusicola TaxID=326684 RepID=UPI002007DA36|nr:uncharacterized protein F5B22DRAFT_612888 [Xylaria bambusicola]KAI0512982.1 hypothetical protein F5B22DRAFT_612888 [Xylaria bambusicola]